MSQKISHDSDNSTYTVGLSGDVFEGTPDIFWETICFIKETKEIWAGGQLYNCIEPMVILSREEYANLENKDPRKLYFIQDQDAIMGIYVGDIPFNVIFHDTEDSSTEQSEQDILKELLKDYVTAITLSDYVKKSEINTYISEYLSSCIITTEELKTYLDE